jgi:hypothetical protein
MLQALLDQLEQSMVLPFKLVELNPLYLICWCSSGQYKFYAVHLSNLSDVSGFPVSIEGHNATNDATRYVVSPGFLEKASY